MLWNLLQSLAPMRTNPITVCSCNLCSATLKSNVKSNFLKSRMFRCLIRMRTSLTALPSATSTTRLPVQMGSLSQLLSTTTPSPQPSRALWNGCPSSSIRWKTSLLWLWVLLTMTKGHQEPRFICVRFWKHQVSMPILCQAMSFCLARPRKLLIWMATSAMKAPSNSWKAAWITLSSMWRWYQNCVNQDRLNQKIWTVVDQSPLPFTASIQMIQTGWKKLPNRSMQLREIPMWSWTMVSLLLTNSICSSMLCLLSWPMQMTTTNSSITTISTRNQIPCWANGSWNRSETGCRRFTAPCLLLGWRM